MPLKLLELPDVPLLKTISLMDIQTLFFLSTLSKKMKWIIRCANITIEKTNLGVDSLWPYLKVKKDNDESEIYFRPLRQDIYFHPFFPLPKFWEFQLNGVLMRCYADSCDWFFSETENNQEPGILETTFTHFFNLFEMIQFNVKTSQTPISSVFLWKFSKEVLRLQITSESAPLSQDDVNVIFNDLKVGVMELEAPVAPDVTHNTAFTNGVVVIRNPTWVNFDSVLNSSSTMIIFLKCTIPRTSQEVNSLIKHWLRGGLGDLAIFQIVLDQEPVVDVFATDVYKQECVSEVEVRAFDQWVRPPEYYRVNYQTGQDVYRDDGKVATIMFTERKLYFFVWPDECITGRRELVSQ